MEENFQESKNNSPSLSNKIRFEKIKDFKDKISTNDKTNIKSIIIGISFLALFLILITAIIHIFSYYRNDIQIEENAPEKKYESFSSELTNCITDAKNETLSPSCQVLFSDYSIGEECSKLDNFTDECFYYATKINLNIQFCKDISNTTLKEICLTEGGTFWQSEDMDA